MSGTVNPDQATFLGFGLEGIAYGIHLMLFGLAIFLVSNKAERSVPSFRPIFAISCLLFCMSTIHFALNFNNVYTSTMVHPRPHIAAETNLLVGADSMFILSDFFSQLVLIYRVYLTWNRNIWIAILPVLVALAALACGFSVIGLVLSIDPTAPQAPSDIVPFGDASFAMSLILNFTSSSLIIGRLWWLKRSREVPGMAPSRTLERLMRQATEIIVESGLLFLATQFVFVILFAIEHPAQALVEPLAVQIYAISPLLILVRVGMGKSDADQTTAVDGGRSSLRFISFATRSKAATGTTAARTQDTGGDVEMALHKSKDESAGRESSSMHV